MIFGEMFFFRKLRNFFSNLSVKSIIMRNDSKEMQQLHNDLNRLSKKQKGKDDFSSFKLNYLTDNK